LPPVPMGVPDVPLEPPWVGDEPTLPDLDRTRDATAVQPFEHIDRGGRPSRLISEETFQAIRRNLGRTALAVVMALPVGAVVFWGWASARAAFDDR
ncbi:MAG TPA: hypothetical protein PLV68_10295, partial [Ilumatobacteraceae bacterium]|nr:hypothetical protein [Ilumatobacteraceae bacterium]